MSDTTLSKEAAAAPPAPAEASRPELAELDALATATFKGATNLNELLRMASRHCQRLVDAQTARIWVARRNGRRLVAREFPETGDAPPTELRQARSEGLAGW